MCAKCEVFYFLKKVYKYRESRLQSRYRDKSWCEGFTGNLPGRLGFKLNDANGKIPFWHIPLQHDPCFTRILTQNFIHEDIWLSIKMYFYKDNATVFTDTNFICSVLHNIWFFSFFTYKNFIPSFILILVILFCVNIAAGICLVFLFLCNSESSSVFGIVG